MRFRDLVARDIVNGPLVAASRVRAPAAADLDGAIELADDPDADTSHRVTALLAIALAAQDGTALPRGVLDLLEDDLLVDAVIATRAEAAITGIVAAMQPHEQLRRYLAVRLAAAGTTGLHVAALLLSVDDLTAARNAALPALIADVRAHADDATIIHAIAWIVAEWMRTYPELTEQLCAALPADVADVLAPAARHFDVHTANVLEAAR